MTQPTEMTRLEFDNGLQMIRESLFTMTGTVTEAVQAATTALLDQNLEAARATASLEQDLEDGRLLIERRTLQLLAGRQPVASERRMLVAAVKISAECWRMGVLAHHIGMAARHFYPAPAIPDELSGIFRRMGDVASRIADDARGMLLTGDVLDAADLEVDDDVMNGLRRALFRGLLDNRSLGVETAVDVALLGRYDERFADHLVALAQSVIFMLTGTKPRIGAPHVG
jgi:phosphate transport system protein